MKVKNMEIKNIETEIECIKTKLREFLNVNSDNGIEKNKYHNKSVILSACTFAFNVTYLKDQDAFNLIHFLTNEYINVKYIGLIGKNQQLTSILKNTPFSYMILKFKNKGEFNQFSSSYHLWCDRIRKYDTSFYDPSAYDCLCELVEKYRI